MKKRILVKIETTTADNQTTVKHVDRKVFYIPNSWAWLKNESGEGFDVFMNGNGDIVRTTEVEASNE